MKKHLSLVIGATVESLIVTNLLKKKLSSQQQPHFKLHQHENSSSLISKILNQFLNWEELKLNFVLVFAHIFWRWLKFHLFRYCRENFISVASSHSLYAFFCTVFIISFMETACVRYWMEYYLLLKRMRLRSDTTRSTAGTLTAGNRKLRRTGRIWSTLEFFVASILIFTVKQMVFNVIFFFLILNLQPDGKEHWVAQFVLGSVAASIGSFANNPLDVYWLRYNEYHLGDAGPGHHTKSWMRALTREELFLGYGWKLLRIGLGNGIMALSFLLGED
uniref:Uncharacterized protein n=1 Tax=Percolomonas cosmopolitus TaxID=63605 RepID=A0A7S1PGJ9_9EUKA